MKPERAHEGLPPGEEDAARQDFRRDPTTWRQRFFARNPGLSENPLECTLYFGTRAHEVADALEASFEILPGWEPRVHTKGRHKGQRY